MRAEEILRLSATALAARIASGEVSSAQAVEACIAQIENVNGDLNAVVVKRYDEARKEAQDADARQKSGEPLGRLHGVPVTVKECIDLVGTPSTYGIPSRKSHRPEKDDPYVARFRRAGAIVLGKTNVSQLLMFAEADNPVYGRTSNPWNLARSCGGSSGGQGAIISAGGVPLGLGTDIGGSVRLPAAFNGIAGFKATTGRLDDPGRYSVPFGQRALLSQVGPLGRTVDDIALGLEVANGGMDPDVWPPMPLLDYRAVDVSTLRVAWHADDGTFQVSPAVTRAVGEAVAALEKRGARVSKWDPPDVREAERLFYGMMAADGFRGMSRNLGADRRDRRIWQMEFALSRMRFGIGILRFFLSLLGRKAQADILDNYGFKSADHYFQLVERQIDYRTKFEKSFDGGPDGPFDVIVCPAFAIPAYVHGATSRLTLPGAYTSLYNVLGWPAGVVPVTRVREGEELADRPVHPPVHRLCEIGSAGLPIGVQVAARPFREHHSLAVLKAIEDAVRAHGEFPTVTRVAS